MRRPDRLQFAYVASHKLVEPGGIDEALELGLLRDNPIGAFKWGRRWAAAAVGDGESGRAPPARLPPTNLRRSIRDKFEVWLWSSDTRVACIVRSRWDASSAPDRAVMEVLQQHLVENRAATRSPVMNCTSAV